MNPELPPNLRAELEARVTAFLLGELPAHEAAALRQQIDDDAQLAELCERLKPAVKLLREAAANPVTPVAETAPLKLSDERRQKLLTHFKTIAPKEFEPAPRLRRYYLFGKYSRIIELAACLIVIFGLASLMLPALSKAKSKAVRVNVSSNLKQIELAKQIWAEDNNKSANDTVTAEDLKSFNLPKPVAGESYIIGKVGEPAAADLDVSKARKVFGRLPTEQPANGGRREMVQLDAEGKLGYVAQNSVKIDSEEHIHRQSLQILAKQMGISSALASQDKLKNPVNSPPNTGTPPQTTVVLPPASQLADSGNAVGENKQLGVGFSAEQPVLTGGSGGGGGGAGGRYVTKDSAALEKIPMVNANPSDISDALSHPEQQHSSSSPFVARNGFVASGTSNLSLDFIHNRAQAPIVDPTTGLPVASSGEAVDPTTGLPVTRTVAGLVNQNGVDELNAPSVTAENGRQSASASPQITGAYFGGINGQQTSVMERKPGIEAHEPRDRAAKIAPGVRAGEILDKSGLHPQALTPVASSAPIANGHVDQSFQWNIGSGGPAYRKLAAGQNQEPTLNADKKDSQRQKSFGTVNGYNLAISDAQLENNASVPASDGLAPSLWTKARQNSAGNVNLADGSVQQFSSTGLRTALAVTNSAQLGDVPFTADPQANSSIVATDDVTKDQISRNSADSRRLVGIALENRSKTPLQSQNSFSAADAPTGPTGSLEPVNVSHYINRKMDKEAELVREEKLLSDFKSMPLQKRRDVVDAAGASYGTPKPSAERNHSLDERAAAVMMGMETRIAGLKAVIKNLNEKMDEAKVENDVALAKPAAPALEPQPEMLTSENAFSTFSLNVSDVSFKLAAASLEKGVLPEPGSIRSEEFINAFDYRDPAPAPGAPIGFAWERARDPFAQNRDLVRFSVKTAAAGREPGRPLNIVLLLDNSGSMERADRVKIIHEALRVLASQLQPQDKLSVVIFARTASLWVDGISGSQAGAVADSVGSLTPQGGTNLEEAMKLAYETARRHYLANGVNRVVLLTDGAANLGSIDPAALQLRVEENRKQGIALDCFGIGWEGYNDDLLEVLTRHGDGRYGFLNTPAEAATDFAGELAGALHVAAADVKVQIEFNPARVTTYRQIGYAKHQLTKEQFRDNTVDAAQIGAAESGNGLYVVAVNPAGTGPLGTVRVRFKVPGTSEVQEHAWELSYTGNAVALDQANDPMRLAATAGAFAEWLSGIPYASEVTPNELLNYLRGVPQVYGADTRPQKLEWMIRQAKSISGK